MIKKLYFIAILLIMSISKPKAQTDSMNIWKITNRFLIENGENTPDTNPYPEWKNGKVIGYSYFIFSSEGYISDPEFALQKKEAIDCYSFGVLGAHLPMHLLFVKDGKWFVINMKKPLLDIMSQVVESCKTLKMNGGDSLFVFSEVLRYSQLNSQNTGGVPILK